jgi:Spy/CpxP family protein refolding chaperone
MNGARLRAFGTLSLVFLAGGGVGWAAGVRSAGASGESRHRGPRGGPRAGMLLDAGPIARYDLTPAQRTRVDSILGARRSQIDAFWKGPGQELRRVLDATAADVRTVLTPQQQARFDSARARHQARMRARFEGRGGPPPSPPAPAR